MSARADYGVAPPGYRLPDATRLGRVVLQIADLERSVAYYRDVIGLAVIRRETGRAELGADGTVLVELRERRNAAPAPLHGRLGLYHFAILLPDRSALGRFVRHLAEKRIAAGASDHLVSEALYLRDPDGLGIEVYADRPRGTWRVSDGELVMSTSPLDLGDLTRASEGLAWTGAPAGTVIGHVHLHVGGLEKASEYYHESLGLDRMVWSYPGALFLAAGGYHHHLGLNTWAGEAPAPGEHEAQLVEWEMMLPAGELPGVVESLQSRGHTAEAQDAGYLTRNPWGTALRLSPDRS